MLLGDQCLRLACVYSDRYHLIDIFSDMWMLDGLIVTGKGSSSFFTVMNWFIHKVGDEFVLKIIPQKLFLKCLGNEDPSII